MLQAFIAVLRESFESFLIVAIILAYLKKSGRQSLIPAVYTGIGVSIIASVGLGYVLMKVVNQSLWEGILGIVTIVLVGSLVVHMWRTAPRLKHDLQERLQEISSKSSGWPAIIGIFFFTVLMITREGMETALIVFQVRDRGYITGIFFGLVAATAISWMWARFGYLINLKRFFQVTGAFLLLFMVQIAIYSLHEFSEAGILPNSDALNAATEPFSPVGMYGKWFSLISVGAIGLWLVGVWIMDIIRRRDSHV
jgi:high-affinity iron transporter